MKRYLQILLALVVVITAFWSGSWYGHGEGETALPKGRKVLHYVDPMNPAHTSSKPGIAPCGMKMEPVFADEKEEGAVQGGGSTMPPGTVRVSPEKQQVIGIEVAEAMEGRWGDTIRVLGRVVPDETRVFRLNAATDGWVKKMLPVTTGSLVRKDELLATFYAPEFFSAMKAYLYGIRSMDRYRQSVGEVKEQSEVTDANLENYRNALRNLGMTEHQLDEILVTKQGGSQVEIRAPEAGFVLTRNITLGERFQRGTELYRIADLSRVWVLADLFEKESRFFRSGATAKVSHRSLDRVISARVSDVLPQFDSASRTLKLRLEIENARFALRPDMFVDVELPVNLPPTLTIPADAVLDSGLRKMVYVDRGNGFFEPRRVETGLRLGGRVGITKGLMAGERVVVSGNFLVDSDSKMKMAAAGSAVSLKPSKATRVATDPVCGMEIGAETATVSGLVSTHDGRTYFFCMAACRDEFGKNPERYLAGTQIVPVSSTPPAGTVTHH